VVVLEDGTRCTWRGVKLDGEGEEKKRMRKGGFALSNTSCGLFFPSALQLAIRFYLVFGIYRDSLIDCTQNNLKGDPHSFALSNARAPSLAIGAASALVSGLAVG
jgi:hypothetical protein